MSNVRQGTVKVPSIRRNRRIEAFWSAAFVAPAAIGFVVFLVVPLVSTLIFSFTDWSGYSSSWAVVGLDNYQKVLTDQRFYMSLLRSFLFMFIHVAVGAGSGLILAFLLSQLKFMRNFFRTLFFFPRVLALSVVGITWSQIYHPTIGLLNAFLEAIGLGGLAHAWLGDTATALAAVSFASAWQSYGFYMVIFLASMQMIDVEMYESAMLDGASTFKQFIHITIPSLYNTISMVLVIGFIAGIKGFGTVWSMTQGGPVDATELTMVYIWRNAFEMGHMSKTLAASIIFGLFIMVMSVVMNQLREGRKEDA